MTLEELTRLLNQQTQYGFTGQATPISYDQIIQAIQGQYTPVQMPSIGSPSINIPQYGANRFIQDSGFGPIQQITEYGNQSVLTPAFKPGAFDIEKFTYKPPVTASDVVSSIGGDGGGSGSTGTGGLSVDDAGLATAGNVTPGMVQALGFVASMFGLPGGLLSLGKTGIANALTNMGYNSAVAQNVATVAAQMGLDPSDPANAAAISSGIDSLSAANQGTQAATAGPAGTGGAAASAAAEAAAAAAAAGMSAEAQGAASQAAADAAIGGASAADAAAAGAAAANAADSMGVSANDAGYSAAADSNAASDASSDAGSSDSGGDSGGGDGGGDGGGGDGGWFRGGFVTKSRLKGKNPKGPDDGYGALDHGEFVINANAMNHLSDEMVDLLVKLNKEYAR